MFLAVRRDDHHGSCRSALRQILNHFLFGKILAVPVREPPNAKSAKQEEQQKRPQAKPR